MMDVLGWLIVLAVVAYLGHHLVKTLEADQELNEEIRQVDMNRQNLQAKYQQLRIKQRALDAQIAKAEKGDDTRKLSELYRQRVALRREISAVVDKM